MIITSHILAEPIFENWKKEIATRKKDQWDWYYLGRHNGFCSLGLTVLIPQKLRVYDQFNASYT